MQHDMTWRVLCSHNRHADCTHFDSKTQPFVTCRLEHHSWHDMMAGKQAITCSRLLVRTTCFFSTSLTTSSAKLHSMLQSCTVSV